MYGLDIDQSNSFLKKELLTSDFKISNNLQLEIHTAISSYLTRIPLICTFFLRDNKGEMYSDKNLYNTLISVDENQETATKIDYLFLLDYDKLKL